MTLRPDRRPSGPLVPLTLAVLVLAATVVRAQPAPAPGAAPPHAEEESAMDGSPPGFRPLRPEVLGHHLEHDPAGDRYRLVDAEGRVLAEGALEDCEQALVARLTDLHGRGHPNLALPTLGAIQFWADVAWDGGWRIQENVLTGHHRLLDPEDTRRAWGSYAACRTELEARRLAGAVDPPPEHLVLLLHGLARHKGVWGDLSAALVEAGYGVAALSYPSTRRSLDEHADQVATVLERLHGVQRVSFVTHSLGGLVSRATLARGGPWRERLPVDAVVMLAPPNQGSALAAALADGLPFQVLAGDSGLDIARLEALDLPAPDVPFGVIAAGRGRDQGWNPWLEGDDDGVVRVEETRLAGAADELTVRGVHTFIMRQAEVIQACLAFLDHHDFEPAADDAPGGDG